MKVQTNAFLMNRTTLSTEPIIRIIETHKGRLRLGRSCFSDKPSLWSFLKRINTNNSLSWINVGILLMYHEFKCLIYIRNIRFEIFILSTGIILIIKTCIFMVTKILEALTTPVIGSYLFFGIGLSLWTSLDDITYITFTSLEHRNTHQPT